MGKRGPKKHEPTSEQRTIVQMGAALGLPQVEIAREIGISDESLRKYYRDELDQGMFKANMKVGGALFNKAIGGDTTAMIFWAKTRMGWSEKQIHEHQGEIKEITVQYVDITDQKQIK